MAGLHDQQIAVGIARRKHDAVAGHQLRAQHRFQRLARLCLQALADLSERVAVGMAHTQVLWALRQDGRLGPFQRAVQVSKAAHRTAYLGRRDPIE